MVLSQDRFRVTGTSQARPTGSSSGGSEGHTGGKRRSRTIARGCAGDGLEDTESRGQMRGINTAKV